MVYSSFNNSYYSLGSITETCEDKNISDIIYETETNWNTLMKAIGILELASVEKHGEVIYEAVDIKAFFRKIKEFFKGLLEKIGRLFKKMIEKIKSLFSKNKHKNIPKNNQSTNSPEKKSSSNDDTEEKRKEEPVNYDHKPIEYEGYEFTTEFLACENNNNILTVFESIDWLHDMLVNFRFADNDIMNNYWYKNYDKFMSDQVILKDGLCNIRTYLTGNKIDIKVDDDFNNVLFRFFRNNENKPKVIRMEEKDIDAYGLFIDDIPNKVDNFLNKQYKVLEDNTNRLLSDWEKILMGESDSIGITTNRLQYTNVCIRWTKIIFEQFTTLVTAHSNAIMAQGNQYKAALKKILSRQPFDAKRYHSSAVFDAFMSNGDGTFVLS